MTEETGPVFNVTSHGQVGGVTAGQINYFGVVKRTLGNEAAAFTAIASEYKGTSVSLVSVLGDSESYSFAHELKDALDKAGWEVDGVSQAVFDRPIEGVQLCFPGEDPDDSYPWVRRLAQWLLDRGIRVGGFRRHPHGLEIRVGAM